MAAKRWIFCLLLSAMLTACAIGDVPAQVTVPPQLTVPAAPSLNFIGSCSNTRELEAWLQVTTRLVTDFQATMNAAAAKTAVLVYEDVVTLIQMRDSAHLAATPDCAADAQLQLTDAMNKAVGAFQAYANGQSSSITTVVTELNTELDEVIATQNSLLAQMNAQILTQIAPTSTP